MDTLNKMDKDLIIDAVSKEPEKMRTCPHCGKSYVWFKKELFKGEYKRTLKVQVPDCRCIELEEKEQERQRFLRHKAEKLQKLFDNSMITPLFKEKTFNNLSQTIEVLKCKEYAKLFDPKSSKGIQMIGNVGSGNKCFNIYVLRLLLEFTKFFL